MPNQIRLAPAQQSAADGLSSGLSKGHLIILRAQAGMGRTAVLSHVHSIVGGTFLSIRQFLDELIGRTPEAIEEAFLSMLDKALAAADLVIDDDLHLVNAVVQGCSYARSNLL